MSAPDPKVVKCPACGGPVVWARTAAKEDPVQVMLDHPPTVLGALSSNKRTVHMVDCYTPHLATCSSVWPKEAEPAEQEDLPF